MADTTRVQGETVMCHSCHSQWPRSHGGLTCPNCESDFVEILSNPPTPEAAPVQRSAPSSRSLSPALPPHPFHNHNPWAGVAPDPEEDDITTFEFNTGGGGRGTFSFSTRTYRSDGNGRHNARNRPFNDGPMLPGLFPFGPGPRPPPGFGQHTAMGGMFPPDPHAPAQLGNINDLFTMIFNSMNQPHPEAAPGQAPNPFAMLSQLFNPGNARHGDAVFSQEAFDRVMTQLMEQDRVNTAPPPASEAAIQSLPTNKVDKEMLGTDGKAECSICMDEVGLDEQVTVLPCNHWFHGQCVVAWLKEHDTCPHCRKPISSHDQAPRQGSSRRRSSRRSSSVASPVTPVPEGSRRNPFTIPEGPSELRAAREQYYGSRRDLDEFERPRSHRHSSHSSSRPSRHDSRSSGSNGGGGNGGGVSGWIRNHLPFQGQ